MLTSPGPRRIHGTRTRDEWLQTHTQHANRARAAAPPHGSVGSPPGRGRPAHLTHQEKQRREGLWEAPIDAARRRDIEAHVGQNAGCWRESAARTAPRERGTPRERTPPSRMPRARRAAPLPDGTQPAQGWRRGPTAARGPRAPRDVPRLVAAGGGHPLGFPIATATVGRRNPPRSTPPPEPPAERARTSALATTRATARLFPC